MKKLGAVKTVAAMTAATVLSKLLGAVRQIIFAGRLGDGIYAVAFAAASKVTLSVFDILFSAAILGCFIPFYSEKKQAGEKPAREFSSSFFTLTLVSTASLALLGVIFSRQIIFLSAPKLSAEASVLAARLLRIMFPMMIFTGGAYVLVGLLQSHGSFILPSVMSSVSNLFIIFILLAVKDIASPRGISYLAAGYVIGWMIQLATLAVPLAKKHLLPEFSFGFKSGGAYDALKMSPAVIVGAWLLPVSSLAANFFLSFVSDSSLAAFDYALSVWIIASGVLTFGICNFIFPHLSSLDTEGKDFADVARRGVGAALLVSLPAAAGMFFLSKNMIAVLYQRGSFTPELTGVCGRILSVLSFSAPAFCVSEVCARVFYAKKNAKIPMISSVCGIGTFLASGAISVFALRAGPDGIAYSFVAGQYAAAAALLVCSAVKINGFLVKSDIKKVILGLASVAVSTAAMGICRSLFGKNPANISLFENFIIIALVFSAGCVIYLLCIFLLRLLPNPRRKEESL